MKERVFLDTNVLVYLFDADDPIKQRRAQDLLSNGQLRTQVILSTQVLQEFYVSVTQIHSIRIPHSGPFKISRYFP
jgi:predicted nucleic acid-binding protein